MLTMGLSPLPLGMKFGAGGKQIKGPVWDLHQVQSLVRSGCFYLMRTSAFDRIAETLGIDDRREIHTVAREGVLALGGEDYGHSLDQISNKMDVYGIVHRSWGWYVKLYIDEEVDGGETTVCSFHPPEFALRTKRQTIPAGGVVTAVEGTGGEEDRRGEPEENNDA
jgi:hypothetical protein